LKNKHTLPDARNNNAEFIALIEAVAARATAMWRGRHYKRKAGPKPGHSRRPRFKKIKFILKMPYTFAADLVPA
jgi:hypothetical protein